MARGHDQHFCCFGDEGLLSHYAPLAKHLKAVPATHRWTMNSMNAFLGSSSLELRLIGGGDSLSSLMALSMVSRYSSNPSGRFSAIRPVKVLNHKLQKANKLQATKYVPDKTHIAMAAADWRM